MEIQTLYSNELKRLLDFMSTNLVDDNPTTSIGIEYFLLSVLENTDCLAYKILNNYLSSIILDTIHDSYYELIHNNSLTVIKPNREVKYSSELAKFLLYANYEKEKLCDKHITSVHVILALLNEKNEENKIRKFFLTTSLTYEIFFNKILEYNKENEVEENITNDNDIPLKKEKIYKMSDSSGHLIKNKKAKTNNINTFCINLNELAEKGKIDKLVGRENEINQIIKILGRRKKNNAILVGESGVGKTAICEGLAYLIQEGNVPQSLSKKRIVSLDMTSMLAGTQFRGMFEERMKGLLDELKNNKDYILFIDDIHTVLSDKPKSDIDIAAMLNNSLNEGDIQIIGTTSFKEYRNTFDNNSNLSRKFQKIIINSPSLSESINILSNIKEYYEKFHGVKYTDNALKACVELANKYISERNLPDSAIDILDESGSAASILVNEPEEIRNIRKNLIGLKKEKDIALKNDNYEKVDEITHDENLVKIELSNLERKIKREYGENGVIVDNEAIYSIISEKTGIPITKLTNDEKKKLSNIDNILKQSIIGQDEAIERVCRVIKRNRVGLSSQSKTMANIFTLGGSGCGKTLLAKKLAKEVFGDEKYLVRFDMSEYSDKTSINKLIGSNPGYVGYDNGGQLTEIIKNKKHCVLLLDEIEKADNEVYNIFLQLFDEGSLTDNTGQKIDFKNVIVILTSNVGAREANERGKGIGLVTDDNINKKDIIQKELKRKFPPEFINRLDDIIYFNTLSDDDLKKIIILELNNLSQRIEKIGYSFEYKNIIIDYIFNIISKEKEYGARPIIRAIQDEIENKITDLLLDNEYKEKHIFKANVEDDKLIIS